MLNKVSKFIRKQLQQPLVLLFSCLVGISLGFLVYCFHWQVPLFSKRMIALSCILAITSAATVYLIFIKVVLPGYLAHSQKIRGVLILLVLLGSLLLAFSLSYQVPHLYFLYPQHQLSIEMDLRDSSSEVDGISFSHLQLTFRDVGYSELALSGQYEIRGDSIFFPSGQVASISWQGITGESALLAFLPTSVDCKMKIIWDGSSSEVNLHQTGPEVIPFTQQFPVLPFENLLIRLVTIPIIAFILTVLISGFFSPNPFPSLIASVWLFILLVYWPGIIGDVNIVAVNDLLAGHPTDWHPIAFTLLVTAGIKLFSSAVSILILQIISLAVIFGNALYFLKKKGVLQVVLWVIALLLAFLPTNFLSIITLTNDLPYSIALLGLSFLSFKIVLSDGKWLENRFNLFLLSTAASTAILFRYNGIPAVAFFFLCLILLFPKQRVRSLITFASVILVWLLVSGPLSSGLNVTRESEGQLDNILLHHISAHVVNGTSLTEEEQAYLDGLYPLDQWEYSCCSNTAMWAKEGFDKQTFHANSTFNRKLFLSLFLRAPVLEVRHLLCASDLIWDPFEGGCEVKHPFIELVHGEYYWTRSYFQEYKESSLLPGLVNPLSRFINNLDSLALASTFLWHPAWYLYLVILCTVIFAHRLKSIKGWLVITPALGQSLFLLLVNRVQNFRYQYCVVLVGLLLLSIAFYHPDSEK
jgi:hypothetical protein